MPKTADCTNTTLVRADACVGAPSSLSTFCHAASAAPPLTLPMNASIVLSLVFFADQVRDRYRRVPRDAYTREFRRIRNLLTSMRYVGTTLPVTVLVGGNRSLEHERELVYAHPHVRLHPVTPFPTPSWASKWHRHSFQKLSAMGLTRYERVLVLDNDCQLRANIDALPSSVRAPAAVWIPASGKKHGAPMFNSGVMVLQPSASALSTLASRALLPAPTSHVLSRERDGCDQQLLMSMDWNWTQLPLKYNANRALCMADADWRDVQVLHLISGFEYSRRSPAWVKGTTFWKR